MTARRHSAADTPSPSARYVLLGMTLLLSLGGLVMIYSASHAYDTLRYADSAYHLKRQALYLAAGLTAMLVASRIPARLLRSLGTWVLIASDALLVWVLVAGYASHGARSWIDLGFMTVQPSEFAKLGIIMTLAALFADRERRPRPIREDALALALILGPPLVLIMLQPDLGTVVAIVLPAMVLAAIGGLEFRYLALAAAALAAALPVAVLGKGYRMNRILAFFDPWADPQGIGYQSIQALLAFGSGGVSGLGLGMSRQKYFYLPEAHNDFVFAIIGEELGLVGALLVVAAFGALAWAGLRIASGCREAYGRLLAAGLTIVVVLQALMNMAAVTGLIPVTGIPLPLVSSGGSSMLFTMLCVGLILSVARTSRASVARRSSVTHHSDEERERAGTAERRRDGRPHLSVIDGGRASARRRA